MFTPLAEEVSESLLIELFEAIPGMMKEIAPSGFANSALIHVFHPDKQQQYKEYCDMESRFQTLFKKKETDQEKSGSIKSFDEFMLTIEDSAIEEQYELVSIYGDCIWDIFSNNHTVYNKNFESSDLGSWRGSGGFIAGIINKLELTPGTRFNYMDFYMGSFVAEQRANLIPVYEFIFKKLKSKMLDWEYYFPRIGLVSFEASSDDNTPMKDYDPGFSLQKELEDENKKKELDELQQQFDNTYTEEYDKARYAKPSQVVESYYLVYGHWPKGHPLAENG